MEQYFRVSLRVDVMEQSFRVSLRVVVIFWTHVWLGVLVLRPLIFTINQYDFHL